MRINTKVLPKDSPEASLLKLKFSESPKDAQYRGFLARNLSLSIGSLLTSDNRGWHGNAARYREAVSQRPNGRGG